MVNLKFFSNKIPLEDFHLEGPAIFSGLDKHRAILFSRRVIRQLKKDKIKTITFYDLVKYSAGFLKDRRVRKKYLILNQYFLSTYDREIDEPFLIFIGGASSAGKDLLASDLQNFLGITRIIPGDLIREAVRSDLVKKYRSLKKIPEKFKLIFERLYRCDDKGIALQIELVEKKLIGHYLEEAYRECNVTGGFHAFFVFHGSHIMPGLEKKVRGKNKVLVVINPKDNTLRKRILSRWEREYGAMTKKNKPKRLRECENMIYLKKYFLKEARKNKSFVINEDDRLKVVHKFGDILISKLEGILKERGVRVVG